MLPILYSFRRCPYAIRARMAIYYASITVELREVSLANKPQQMLALSPKGTVPVLQLPNKVLDESLDVIHWALQQSDSDGWLRPELQSQTETLIESNDNDFKAWLDKYKYWERFPEQPQLYYRERAEEFIALLENLLEKHRFLLGQTLSVADIAIFPFIRQFAFVDKEWFDSAPYPNLQRWLQAFLVCDIFVQSMIKQPVWQEGDSSRPFPDTVAIDDLPS
jgi:glutathione S-transferase